ncbi:CDP-glycerol:glycerophosphate glycerophosphotransferase [Neobacillus sp. MER 74]|uniref:bifunctional glycosyltransferase/CDP-glycerol:glycerophosphate glycerophosphotransferase n=1 Tax=Neobacillus sp. MER 74 TaxID=2939566 RepID=UPI0020425146|nr:CDP-glycerol glycerophosphotransferase family protein [Neobacillus sp. MER 74]MCM3115328.1 CDP-glycerol:glycerophosphate glycerophosphotransferase [Neobacillus sp. MER 74]
MEPENRSYNDFYFSIIMAVYNVEDYLKEAVESIINQTLNFDKHIQLILINDGSIDESGKLCKKFQKKYPNNIVFIDQENQGVSSARNAGLEAAKGKYVNFLDPDDKLSLNALEKVYNFFEKQGKDIDVVSIPIYWFDQAKGEHLLNYKYASNRIINILKDHRFIQMSASSSFVRRTAIGEQRFKETLKYGEDAEWLNRIILKKCEYGVVKKAKYHYRKRSTNTSATQQALQDKDYYLHSLKNFSFTFINMSLEILGFVPKYFQYMIMYDLQWRLNNNDLNVLMTAEETENFLKKLKELLSFIDEDIILEQKHLNMYRKNYLLRIKYDQNYADFYQPFHSPNNAVLLHGNRVMDALDQHQLAVELINIENKQLFIEGHFTSLFENSDTKIVADVNGEMIETQIVERFYKDTNVFGKNIKKALGIKFNFPLDKIGKQSKSLKVTFYVIVKESKVKLDMLFSGQSHLKDNSYSYFNKNGYMVIYQKKKKQFLIRKSEFKLIRGKEIAVLKTLYKLNKPGSRKALLIRLDHFFQKHFFQKKRIWLFMDRVNKADDNAEVLFEYATKQQDGIQKYFVINQDSEDFKRLQKIGNVIPYGSRQHKRYLLLADKLISSHADEFIVNPFGKMKKYLKDLFTYDFIFLQHGITKDDISSWLNKYKKNIRLFITAANQEYDSIVNGHYDYTEKEVLLSGFPRFDKLQNDDKKRILIMPTWRSDLVAKLNPITGTREYNPVFKESEYFKAFNDLLNNEKLLKAAKEKGYKLVFFPHPNIRQQLKDYQIDDSIEVADMNSSYRDNFNQSSLLVTDFSSVAFDFAYLKKPVIYYQFGMNHLAEGYFDYQTMGFGDVLTESEQVADRIIQYMNQNCQMEAAFQERVNQFYSFTDQDNCKRVYEAIRQINQPKKSKK